ncbi:hypothetical protein SynBIOSE41_02401 [Synechococcus sp. BIOS-E4-1]|nr:hypothetical protein SynBIOSE41_02401 [Synechococcus sp. BIOS-E4-1]
MIIYTALNRARYRGLIVGLFGVIEALKSPCVCRDFDE